MKKEKDEGLDDLFRKGLADPVSEPAFRDADWDAMEQMLDKKKRRPAIVYWLPYIGSVAALLLIFLGWMLFKPDAVKPTKHDQIAAAHNHSPGSKDNDKINVQKEDTGTSGGPARQAADSSKQKILNPAGYANTPASSRHGQKSNSFFNTLSAGRARRPVTGKAVDNTPDAALAANRLATNNDTADKQNAGVNSLAANGQPKAPLADTAGKQNVIANNTSTVNTQPENLAANPTVPETPKKANKPVVKARLGNRPQFALGILASSDLNGVNSLQQSKIGGNFGLQFSVGLSKWTISTGASYSIKPYTTGFENYHTGYQFTTTPTNVSANCRMLDIPLNINYQLYSKGGNKFTVGSGISSYIILHERYWFNYDNTYNSGSPAVFNVVNKNRNYFGIVNLDFTYQHQINSKVGLLIEPYYKLPLADVGASKVRLQTAGVAVGLNWNLNSFTKH